MIYYVDIDETICYHADTNTEQARDYSYAKPRPERIAKINGLFDEGHTVVYWTARGSGTGIDWKQVTESQLISWGAKYTSLQTGKPIFDVFIDDKAFNSEIYFERPGKD